MNRSLFDEPIAETKARPAAPTPVKIWCDGACSGNPGPGGWGSIVEEEGLRRELSGGRSHTTNNQMELQGLIEALKSVPAGTRVEICTDSKYVVDGVSSWIKGWKRNGWMTASKQPVKNRELWQELDELLQARPHKMLWVRGHNGHAENERCDELARMAILTL